MMPDTLVLTPRVIPERTLELEGALAPGALGGEAAMARVRVWHGREAAELGDFYSVRGGAGARLGAAVPGAARGMTGGEIVVAGSAGAGAGRGMRRGLVVVGGDAGAE